MDRKKPASVSLVCSAMEYALMILGKSAHESQLGQTGTNPGTGRPVGLLGILTKEECYNPVRQTFEVRTPEE